MSDQKKGDGASRRRQVLRGIVSGSGIAGVMTSARWAEPVVRTVTLPAHATTSVAETHGLSRFSLTVEAGTMDVAVPKNEWFAGREKTPSPLDWLVPRARAMDAPYRQMVLVEKPGHRFDFTMLQSRFVSAGCLEESLISARDVPLFTPTPSDSATCQGGHLAGPEVEVIDVVDDGATIRLDSSETYTLLLDPEARPMAGVTPCPCLGD